MPYTLNGIGTVYYGQRNFRSHPGCCSSCGFVGELRSYETRKWFVIFLIPVIPLGKKQIMDFCPKCSRHKVIPLAKWRELETKSMQNAQAEVITRPDDAQACLQFHRNLVVFNRQVEAQTKAEELRKRFPGDYDVQFYLGTFFESIHRPLDADSCLNRALELRPDSLPARRAVGIGAIIANNLQQARRLLSFMEQPGPYQDPAVLIKLAYAYQRHGEHGQALDLFRVICRDFPALAKKDKQLRRAVIQAQTSQGGTVSILPRAAINRKLVWTMGIALVILGGLLGFEWYSTFHQTLFLVNGFAVPAEIDIPPFGKFSIPPHNVVSATLPEGSYKAVVTLGNNPRQNVSFKLSNSFWQRFEENRTFILNAGCGAAIMEEVVIYSSNPDPNEQPVRTLTVNQPFIILRNLDYIFTEFPEEINLSNNQPTSKRRVTMVREKMEPTIFAVYSLTHSLEQACKFTENHLAVEPLDEALLDLYVYLSASANRIPQALAFVKGYIHLRPIQIPWHRTYQILSDYSGNSNGLATEYDRLLQREPGDSALLYLRGRVATGLDEALSFYDQAIAANPSNPFPWYAKGYDLAMRMNFKAAEPLLLETIKLNPQKEEYRQMLREVRLGNGNLAELETDLRTARTHAPDDMGIAVAMLEVLVRQNRAGEIAGFIKELTKSRPRRRDNVPLDPLLLGLVVHYIQGDVDGYLKQAAKVGDPGQKRQIFFEGYLSESKLAEAEKLLVSNTDLQNADRYLELGLGWRVLGRDEIRGEKWFEKARIEYSKAFTEERVAAEILSGTNQNVVEKIDASDMPFQSKVVLYLAAAQLYPSERALLLKRAAAMNFHLTYPHLLVKAVLARRGK